MHDKLYQYGYQYRRITGSYKISSYNIAVFKIDLALCFIHFKKQPCLILQIYIILDEGIEDDHENCDNRRGMNESLGKWLSLK